MISPVGNMALITGIAPLGLDRAKSLSRDSPLNWGLPAELARLLRTKVHKRRGPLAPEAI